MKKFRKLITLTSLFILILLGAATNVHAQLGPGGGPGDPGCDPLGGDGGTYPDGTPCPIDGGVAGLLVLGAAYGVKKIVDTRKAATAIY